MSFFLAKTVRALSYFVTLNEWSIKEPLEYLSMLITGIIVIGFESKKLHTAQNLMSEDVDFDIPCNLLRV